WDPLGPLVLAVHHLTPSPCPRVPTASPCGQPLEEGGCERYTLRWYYSQRGAECRPFVYSGCGGNANRFGSRRDCELRCGGKGLLQGVPKRSEHNAVESSEPDQHHLTASPCPRVPTASPCGQPLEEGGCERYTLRWYYSQRGAECRPFVYSGCGGNANRFGSRHDCELRCGGHAGTGRHGTTQHSLAPRGEKALIPPRLSP
uniref:BPTI/Kunitz inhibitor domain-containing protein n=1 Tax=Anas zonorhyncha TaxID=75864 RepID=A0A8B9VDJ6_9AVES